MEIHFEDIARLTFGKEQDWLSDYGTKRATLRHEAV